MSTQPCAHWRPCALEEDKEGGPEGSQRDIVVDGYYQYTL